MARLSAAQREVVREKLVATAARHFAEHGLNGANINRISVDAGFGKGTVYNYFDSKEALFAAVLSVGSEATLTRYRQLRQSDQTVRERLVTLMRADAEVVREHEAFMRVFVGEWANPKPATQALVLEAVAPLLAETSALVAEAQHEGLLATKHSSVQLASILLGQLTLAYIQLWSTGGHWPTWDELPGLVVDVFWDGAASR